MTTLEQALEKKKNGMALTKSDLALCSGYSRWTIYKFEKEGLPFFHGKVTWRRYEAWLKERENESHSHTSGHPQPESSDKSDEPSQRNDLLSALPQRLERLLAKA